MTAPEIVTERLILRGMRQEDFPDFAAIWADARVASQVGVPPRGRADSWTAFLWNAGHWQLTGYGQWAVTDRITGAWLGQTGMFRAYRGYGAEFDDWPEAGWVLSVGAQGRGLGREAAEAAHRWFDRVIGGPVVARIDEGNDVSRRLAARLGYVPMAENSAAPGRVLFRREAGGPA